LVFATIIVCSCDQPPTKPAVPTDSVPIADWASRIDTLTGEYSRIVRPAEFWDSILIVPGLIEKRLWKLNIATGERALFGSRGGGPGEYARVAWAFKVHTDSVARVWRALCACTSLMKGKRHDLARDRGRRGM